MSTPSPRTSISTRVNDRPLGQAVLENRAELGDRRRRRDGRLQQRDLRPLRFDDQLGGGAKPPVMSTHGRSNVKARRSASDLASPVQALEEPDLALAEDQHAARLEVFVEAGQREAGLLHVRTGDQAVEAVGAGQQLEREAERLRAAPQEGTDADA